MEEMLDLQFSQLTPSCRRVRHPQQLQIKPNIHSSSTRRTQRIHNGRIDEHTDMQCENLWPTIQTAPLASASATLSS